MINTYKEIIDEFRFDIVEKLNPCCACQQTPYAGIANMPAGDGYHFRAYIVGCEHCGWSFNSTWAFDDLISKWNTEDNGRR